MFYVSGGEDNERSREASHIRTAIKENYLALTIQKAMDTITVSVEESIEYITAVQNDGDSETISPIGARNECEQNDDGHDNTLSAAPVVGESIEVFWQPHETSYARTIASTDEDQMHHIYYNDGENEILNLKNET